MENSKPFGQMGLIPGTVLFITKVKLVKVNFFSKRLPKQSIEDKIPADRAIAVVSSFGDMSLVVGEDIL